MVEVRVPAPLRAHTQGSKVVQGDGGNVAEVLDDLERRYPGLKSGLFNDAGELRQFVNVYVNDEDIRYLDKLDTALTPGDTVSILPAVAGGSGESSQEPGARSQERGSPTSWLLAPDS